MYSCLKNVKPRHFSKKHSKTRHSGKITAFDENHGFRDFRDFLLSLIVK